MKKTWLRVLPLILCLNLTLGTAAADAAARKKDEDKVIPIKVTAKEVLNPPYVITLENITKPPKNDDSSGLVNVFKDVKLVGKKDNVGDDKMTGSGWTFSLYFEYCCEHIKTGQEPNIWIDKHIVRMKSSPARRSRPSPTPRA